MKFKGLSGHTCKHLILCLWGPERNTFVSDNSWVFGTVLTLTMYVYSSGSEIFTTSLILPSSSSPGAFLWQDLRWLGMSGSSSWASVISFSPTLGRPERSRSKNIWQSLFIWYLSDTSITANCGPQDYEVAKTMANLITCQMSCHVFTPTSYFYFSFFFLMQGKESHSQAYNQTYFRKK